MSDFFRKHDLILSEVFWYMEKSKNLEKIFRNRARTGRLLEKVWLNSASQSPENGL